MLSFIQKLETLSERHQELSHLLAEPEVLSDSRRFRDLSREYAHLEDIVSCYRQFQVAQTAINDAQELLKEEDPELRALAKSEIEKNETLSSELSTKLQVLLLPQDPNDNRNVFLEIRAGTGGNEAAIFVGDLFRMYARYVEKVGWQLEIMNESHSEQGGYKEVIVRVIGNGAYSHLKFESGTHRVQRVPVTESQGRIHTSACTVAILPEVDEIEEIDIQPNDLKIDTYRASGAGGQHVNKTDSAIRITHLPSGIVVECQDERSQHKNRARAMSLLKAKLLTAEQEKQISQQAQHRKLQVGSGDRSERIRTYNYPQGRITDHRINLTVYKLADVLEGEVELLIEPLRAHHQAELLAELSRDSN